MESDADTGSGGSPLSSVEDVSSSEDDEEVLRKSLKARRFYEDYEQQVSRNMLKEKEEQEQRKLNESFFKLKRKEKPVDTSVEEELNMSLIEVNDVKDSSIENCPIPPFRRLTGRNLYNLTYSKDFRDRYASGVPLDGRSASEVKKEQRNGCRKNKKRSKNVGDASPQKKQRTGPTLLWSYELAGLLQVLKEIFGTSWEDICKEIKLQGHEEEIQKQMEEWARNGSPSSEPLDGLLLAKNVREEVGVLSIPCFNLDDCPQDEWVCAICNLDSWPQDALVVCDGCDVVVHQTCYGIPTVPEGDWYCQQCIDGTPESDKCSLCPVVGGVLKKSSTDNMWTHLLCAIWIPETRILDETYMEPVGDLNFLPRSRFEMKCCFCQQRGGACMKCCYPKCKVAFHVQCGFMNGIATKVIDQGKYLNRDMYCKKHVRNGTVLSTFLSKKPFSEIRRPPLDYVQHMYRFDNQAWSSDKVSILVELMSIINLRKRREFGIKNSKLKDLCASVVQLDVDPAEFSEGTNESLFEYLGLCKGHGKETCDESQVWSIDAVREKLTLVLRAVNSFVDECIDDPLSNKELEKLEARISGGKVVVPGRGKNVKALEHQKNVVNGKKPKDKCEAVDVGKADMPDSRMNVCPATTAAASRNCVKSPNEGSSHGHSKISVKIENMKSEVGAVTESIGLAGVGHTNWLFQANPKIYRIRDSLENLKEMTWNAKQRFHLMRPGDKVYIWESGERGGIVAVARIASYPAEMPEEKRMEAYYQDRSLFNASGVMRVKVKIERVLPMTLKKSHLSTHRVLKEMNIFRAPIATNFAIRPAEAVALDAIMSAFLENPKAAFGGDTACRVCGNGDDDENMLLCDTCDLGHHTYCLPSEEVNNHKNTDTWNCLDCRRKLLVTDPPCIICDGTDHEDKMLLCDNEDCQMGFHMFCLSPPLESVPDGDWFCPNCMQERERIAGAKSDRTYKSNESSTICNRGNNGESPTIPGDAGDGNAGDGDAGGAGGAGAGVAAPELVTKPADVPMNGGNEHRESAVAIGSSLVPPLDVALSERERVNIKLAAGRQELLVQARRLLQAHCQFLVNIYVTSSEHHNARVYNELRAQMIWTRNFFARLCECNLKAFKQKLKEKAGLDEDADN